MALKKPKIIFFKKINGGHLFQNHTFFCFQKYEVEIQICEGFSLSQIVSLTSCKFQCFSLNASSCSVHQRYEGIYGWNIWTHYKLNIVEISNYRAICCPNAFDF